VRFYTDQEIGKIVQVYRRNMSSILNQVQQEKTSDTTLYMSICPSKVFITRLKLDEDHKKILEWKDKSCQVGEEKGKYKEDTIKKKQE
jgi:large subunit ribosomal protein L26e